MTLMAEAELIINSRPLTHVSIDHNDDEALTPNHFLIGTSGGYQPMGNFEYSNLDLKSRWRMAQHLADLFWKRWIKEYLPCLTRRTKWLDPARPIRVGDIVIIADERLPRNCWPKGIVTRTILGKDEKCRVADVRTKLGTFRRPVSRLCVLDVQPFVSDVA
ncbi:unnamed protein product [Allacma fusca]|uniref:DUF5641 domain-containing protein n=1 Tax=Allacma fusca TaxID=39272 RepID=A0A8J2LJ43_9HEXA|nr:unnamed protein product [Allacma fusca]